MLLAALNPTQAVGALGRGLGSSAMTRANLRPGQTRLRELVALSTRNSLGLIESVLSYQGDGPICLLAYSNMLAATSALVG